jgi:hypothetical protein
MHTYIHTYIQANKHIHTPTQNTQQADRAKREAEERISDSESDEEASQNDHQAPNHSGTHPSANTAQTSTLQTNDSLYSEMTSTNIDTLTGTMLNGTDASVDVNRDTEPSKNMENSDENLPPGSLQETNNTRSMSAVDASQIALVDTTQNPNKGAATAEDATATTEPQKSTSKNVEFGGTDTAAYPTYKKKKRKGITEADVIVDQRKIVCVIPAHKSTVWSVAYSTAFKYVARLEVCVCMCVCVCMFDSCT